MGAAAGGVVGARPCSAGGGFLSQAVQAVFGPVTEQESADRIVSAAAQAPSIGRSVLAHSGPAGLGSDANSPCGRDWKQPHIDWGDRDLAFALDRMQKQRRADLVVFGHMPSAERASRADDVSPRSQGTCYVNAACVPRSGCDQDGKPLHHFTWVEFDAIDPV